MATERKTNVSAITAETSPSGTMAGTLSLAFSHGKTLQVRLSDLSPEILEQAALHGLKQKLVDAAAISRDPDTGRSATIEDKFAAVEQVFLRLTREHAWNAVVRDGSGGGSGGLLRAALVRLFDGRQTPEQIDAFLAGKTDAEKAALRATAKIAPIVETIKAERAAKSQKVGAIDTDALLGELTGE